MACSPNLSEEVGQACPTLSLLPLPCLPAGLTEEEEMEEYLKLEDDFDFENDGPIYDCTLPGDPLIEVFSVRINNIDKENPGDLYGKIMVDDGLCFQCIYNHIIKPGDNNLLLTGPARFISSGQSFTIKVLITDKDNEEVINGEIFWHAFPNPAERNKPLNFNIVGRHGSVSVNFVPFGVAAAVNVEVMLVGEEPANVYGELTATNPRLGDDCKSVLFQKSADESINVSPGHLIPSSRSLVAVPCNSSLVVVANLYDHNTVSSNGEIANGTAEFSIESLDYGAFEEQIISGKIRVKVTWKYE